MSQSLEQLINRPFETPPFVIEDGILNEGGILVIGGPPKSYKSFLLNTLLFHLSTGTNLFGANRKSRYGPNLVFNIPRPFRSLLIEQEIGDFSLAERMRSIANTVCGSHRQQFLQNNFSHSCDRSLRLDTSEGISKIGQVIETTKPDILILDPLIEFHAGDENSSQDMARIMRGIDYLRDKYKVSVILSHHSGKPSETRQGADTLRGSSVIYGKGDAFFMLDVLNRESGIVQVHPTIRRGKPIQPFLLDLTWQDCRFRFRDWSTPTTTAAALGCKARTEMEQ